MLVPTRKIVESIFIPTSTGEEIKMLVLSTKGNLVQIGTEAPGDVSIVREEVLEHINCTASNG